MNCLSITYRPLGRLIGSFFSYFLIYVGVSGSGTPLIHCAPRFPAVRRNRCPKQIDICPRTPLYLGFPMVMPCHGMAISCHGHGHGVAMPWPWPCHGHAMPWPCHGHSSSGLTNLTTIVTHNLLGRTSQIYGTTPWAPSVSIALPPVAPQMQ